MIELRDISKTYRTGKVGVQAICGVSLKIGSGEFVAIMGPSGSGKSTLMHILGFLDRPDSGLYYLGKRDITKLTDNELATLRNKLAGFVFQGFHLLPRLNTLGNVELPLIYAGKRHLKENARQKIEDVGLQHRLGHRPNELSGGEQQRIAIARALVNEPLIILADEPTGNLDTKSQEEIMGILRRLNQTGKTIIMVTHESEVARYAKRIIRMRDGKVISDENVSGASCGNPPRKGTGEEVGDEVGTLPGRGPADSIENILSGGRHSPRQGLSKGSAEIIDHLRQALQSITSHKLRTALSMLGILIGVSAVIAMLALGEGAKESISKSLATLGSNLLTIRPGSARQHGVALEVGAVTRFRLQDADAISKLPQVRRVSPVVSGRAQVVYGNKNWNTHIQGTGVDYAEMRAYVPVIGRFFTEEELRMRKKVALLGTTVVKELFGDSSALGATIKINRVSFQVIGVTPEKGATTWRDQDDLAIMPVTTAMYRLLGKEYVDSIDVEVRDAGLIEEAQESIGKLIIKLRAVSEDSFEIRNMHEIQETLASTTKTMAWLLGSIAAISLLVGGIGIMNIMLVSVTERTREIGLRKAIGARAKDIMSQFLIESVVMTFIGGIIGIILGVGIAIILSLSAGWTTKVSGYSIVLATLFSIVVGIGFGLWPAYQASKLNPIEALRYE